MSEQRTETTPAPAKKTPTLQDALRLVHRLAGLMLDGAKLHEGAEDQVRKQLRELRDAAAELL